MKIVPHKDENGKEVPDLFEVWTASGETKLYGPYSYAHCESYIRSKELEKRRPSKGQGIGR